MTAFASCFFFLRNPAGGVENISDMKAAGFQGVFCNIGDFAAGQWTTIRNRCAQHGMFCGPWARCDSGEPPQWSSAKLDNLIAIADAWGQPFIVNAEKGVDGSGATITEEIASKVGKRDAAISMEAIPFASVDWTPVGYLPILPQNFPVETGRTDSAEDLRQAWWNVGVRCVYITNGTYGGATPSMYVLKAPYSLYTADDVMGGPPGYSSWSPTSTGWQGCKKEEPPMSGKEPLTPQQVPYTGPYSLASGPHRSRGLTAKALKIAMKRMGEEPFVGKDNASFDEHYNAVLEAALDRTTSPVWDGYGEKRWTAVRGLVIPAGRSGAGEYALNKEARDLILKDAAQMAQPTGIPDLGPDYVGGKSVLDYDPTHPTSGIPLFPAYDTAFKAGTVIIACEDMTVDTKESSSNPGKAFYSTGVSRLRHWYGHLVSAPPLGKQFKKGEKVGVVLDHTIGGGPHCHRGVNVEELWGKGKQLEWGANGNGPDYTHGSPTIREQLERALL